MCTLVRIHANQRVDLGLAPIEGDRSHRLGTSADDAVERVQRVLPRSKDKTLVHNAPRN